MGPGTPPSNIKCRINAGHDRPAPTTAAAYVFSKPFFVLPSPLSLEFAVVVVLVSWSLNGALSVLSSRLAILSSLLFRSLFLALSRSPSRPISSCSFALLASFPSSSLIEVSFTSLSRYFYRRFAFFLLSRIAGVFLSCVFFLFFSLFFTYIRMFAADRYVSSYCRSLAADIHVVSLGHDLSLYRRDRPRQGRRSSIQGGQTPALPSLVGISHGFGLRTAVDLIAEDT